MTSATDSNAGPASGLDGPTPQPVESQAPLTASAPAPVATYPEPVATSPAPVATAPSAPAPAPASGASINETVIYEGGPALGDLIGNLLFGLTIIGIPFAVAAIVRALWVRYRITSRRITVNGGWLGRDRTQVVYSQIREVRSVPRGFGSWGDMVLVLDDGSRLEMRAMPRFRELEVYIEERRRSSAKTTKTTKTPKTSKGQASRPNTGFTSQERPSA
jgi:hypothetical protein